MRLYITLILALLLSVVLAGCGDNNGGEAATQPPLSTVITESAANAPTVSSTTPTDGENGVITTLKVVATFSTDMDPLTITDTSFTVMQGTSLLLGVVTYSVPNRTATFAPTSEMIPSTAYTATITNEVTTIAIIPGPTDVGANGQTVPLKSVANGGTALAADKVWTFTTESL